MRGLCLDSFFLNGLLGTEKVLDAAFVLVDVFGTVETLVLMVWG